jgi:Lon-like protease
VRGSLTPSEERETDVRRILQLVAPAAALAISASAVELPVFVESPGTARAVLPLIDVDGTATYASRGEFLLTTVSLGRPNLYQWVGAWLDPAAVVLGEDQVLVPGQTDREYEEVSRSQMDQSKIAAVAVALEPLTDYPDRHGPGVIVQDVAAGTPADGSLFAGDLIVSVDGDRLDDIGELRRRIARAGTERHLTVRVRPLEGGETRQVSLRPARIEGVDRPVIGIASVANFPFDVRIASEQIGGPSAGLMWALGVTDLLTSRDLTDGRKVAGTGTVDLEGRIGPIGGVRMKVLAAEEAGAELFLVPGGNLREARGAGEAIDLVPVSTVEEAVAALDGAA